MNETLPSTTHLGETRLMEQMLIIDAVHEAIAQFGRVAFAQSVQDKQQIDSEATAS
ncbi:hypothetical protein [Comamonas terrigena]|uniref:hypothetical protein n=1 Tax=Comamonas terrigena TaxID=32013 RepID=UPI0028A0CB0E|nr:hypothetical protein [Comamonas terrigena]